MNSTPDISSSQILQPIGTLAPSPQRGFSDIEEIHPTGFSIVLKARRDGRWWCLKAVGREKRGDCLYTELLRKEYDILMQLQHPYVVQAVSMEEVEDYGLCIVMEYVDGYTLRALLCSQDHHLSFREKHHILGQLLEAMQYAHSKQIVHRDLKPENILITRNGHHVKVIDFGLSDTDSYCILKQPAGTPSYMSPEQQHEHLADIRNDIYSIGLIMRDMQLGWRYLPIIRKCLAPTAKRYANINALQRSIASWRLLYWIAVVGIILTLLLAAVAIGLTFKPTHEDTLPNTLSTHADTLARPDKKDTVLVALQVPQPTKKTYGTKAITAKCMEQLRQILAQPEYDYQPSMSHNDFIFARCAAEKNITNILAPYKDKLPQEEYNKIEDSLRVEFYSICNERYYGKQ